MDGTNARWDAYRDAIVRVWLADQVLEVGPVADLSTAASADRAVFPFAPDATVHIITAYDSSDADEAANEARNAALRADLDALGVTRHRAVGADPAWTHQEVSFAAIGLTRDEALELGRRHEQDAIFEWTHDRWRLVACRSGRVEQMHWTARTVGG